MIFKFKALLLTSLSGRGWGIGQGAGPTGPRKGWGGEGGGQEKSKLWDSNALFGYSGL